MENSADKTKAGDATPVTANRYFRQYFRYFKTIGFARAVAAFFVGLCLVLSATASYAETEKDAKSSSQPQAPARRAFLVGIQRYSDGYIQRLDRAANDAKDLAKDLEEVGFDKKNIKVAVDLRDRDAFEKEFSAFLNTIHDGDDVVFYFSGHGFGIEADQTNYLLFADLKSPFTYAKSQLSDQDRNKSGRGAAADFAISRRLSDQRNSQRRFGKRDRTPDRGEKSQGRHDDLGCVPVSGAKPTPSGHRTSSWSSAATIRAAGC